MSKPKPREEPDIATQIVELRPRLVGFARSLTHDSATAEDLAQETIARALASQWRFEPATNLKAWLFRILRNIHLNAVRDGRSNSAVVSIEELVASATPDSDGADPVEARVFERADLQELVEAYRTLPAAFALPLYLTAVEELSYAEAASILDIPIGTVMSRIHRARRMLVSRIRGGA